MSDPHIVGEPKGSWLRTLARYALPRNLLAKNFQTRKWLRLDHTRLNLTVASVGIAALSLVAFAFAAAFGYSGIGDLQTAWAIFALSISSAIVFAAVKYGQRLYSKHKSSPAKGEDDTIPDTAAEFEVDPENDQRDDEVIEEPDTSGAARTILTRELTAKYKSLMKYRGQTICGEFVEPSNSNTDTVVTSSITFRVPDKQRSSLAIRINSPMNMNSKVNPRGYRQHTLEIKIPAQFINSFEFTNFPDGYELKKSDGFQPKEGIHEHDGTPYPLSLLKITSSKGFISGSRLPPLATKKIQSLVQTLIRDIRSRTANDKDHFSLEFVIRRPGTLAEALATDFNTRRLAEREHDPALDWIQNSPNAESFAMGNLKPILDQPDIGIQRAETVFIDRKDHLIPAIYGSFSQDNFEMMTTVELSTHRLCMTIMECVDATNPADNPVGDSFLSTAYAYIACIDVRDKGLVLPDTGATLQFILHIPDHQPVPEDPQQLSSVPPAAERQRTEIELGNEDDVDVFDEDLNEDQGSDPHCWTGRMVDFPEITPPGHILAILERRRQPGWEGRPEDRPFVNTPLPTVNFRGQGSTEELKQALEIDQGIGVTLKSHYSNQGFKDQVRCADELSRSLDEQKQRIYETLLCHNTEHPPLDRVDLLQLKGDSPLNLHKHFNATQKAFYDSLSNTPEITLLHGPFGSGKTDVCLTIATEIMSNPEIKNEVLALVDSNAAVDDIAQRWCKKCNEAGLKKKIIRLHSLKGEKGHVYRRYGLGQAKPQQRFHVPDSLANEIVAISYLHKLSQQHASVRARGDSRRVLEPMSLAQAMFDKLQSSEAAGEQRWQILHGWLREYATDGFRRTEVDRRTAIKLALNDLMAVTISEADGIACTVASAALINLRDNFRPALVILDEAARITELKALIPFASFGPLAFLLAADHKQMRAYVSSAGRSRDPVPYINAFESQLLMSMFERLILAGLEHTMLTMQHRCKGDIADWTNDTFYWGEVQKAPLASAEETILSGMSKFVHKQLGAPKNTNLYAVNIQQSRSSKEPNGTSSINESEIEEIFKDLELMKNDSIFAKKTICLASFYKAQVARLKVRCREFLNVTVMGYEELLRAITVDSSQGMQFDVVLLSLVKTRGISFLGEPHRLVVALTRAKWILGIYTNWDLVKEVDNRTYGNKFICSLFKYLATNKHVIDRFSSSARTCNNCGEAGHIVRECPQPKPEICKRCRGEGRYEEMTTHLLDACTYERPATEYRCRECQQWGHKRASCPQVICNRCHEHGHTEGVCSVPAPLFCNKCKKNGHASRNCKTPLTRQYLLNIRAGIDPNADTTAASNEDGIVPAVTQINTGDANDSSSGSWQENNNTSTTIDFWPANHTVAPQDAVLTDPWGSSSSEINTSSPIEAAPWDPLYKKRAPAENQFPLHHTELMVSQNNGESSNTKFPQPQSSVLSSSLATPVLGGSTSDFARPISRTPMFARFDPGNSTPHGADQFVGLTVQITLNSQLQYRGIVESAVGGSVTLRHVSRTADDVFFPSFVVDGADIAEIEQSDSENAKKPLVPASNPNIPEQQETVNVQQRQPDQVSSEEGEVEQSVQQTPGPILSSPTQQSTLETSTDVHGALGATDSNSSWDNDTNSDANGDGDSSQVIDATVAEGGSGWDSQGGGGAVPDVNW